MVLEKSSAARPYFYSAVRRKRNTNPTCPGDCLSCIILSTPYLLFFIKKLSLRSRRLEVVGTRKNRRAPVLSFARYFQAPATQAKRSLPWVLGSYATGETLEATSTL